MARRGVLKDVVACAGVFALAAWVYLPTLTGRPVYDDTATVTENADVRPDGTPLSAVLQHDFWGKGLNAPGSNTQYRPLTVLSYRLDCRLGCPANATPASPASPACLARLRWTDLLLHAAAAALVHVTARAVARLPCGAAVAAGALFAVHPVHIESVATLYGRADVLCAVLQMLALDAAAAAAALVRRRALRATLLRAAGSPRLSLAARAALTACLATWDEVDADARAHIAGAVAAVARELGTLRREMANNKDRKDVAQLVEDLEGILRDQDLLLKRTHWIVGGDGWAHDIGFGGLDHVLATRTPVRVLVLDNENYANTGGQQSKATSIGAVAKLASRGKATPKKDLGLYALAMHPHAYVASVCYGADPAQTLRALRDADAHDGPALVVAYCPCIEHQPAGGFSGATAIDHMRTAVRAGYWPLYTRTPGTPLRITSRPGTPRALDSFLLSEGRFSATLRNHPERALLLRAGLQAQIAARDRLLAKLAEASAPPPRVPPKNNDSDSKNNNKASKKSK